MWRVCALAGQARSLGEPPGPSPSSRLAANHSLLQYQQTPQKHTRAQNKSKHKSPQLAGIESAGRRKPSSVGNFLEFLRWGLFGQRPHRWGASRAPRCPGSRASSAWKQVGWAGQREEPRPTGATVHDVLQECQRRKRGRRRWSGAAWCREGGPPPGPGTWSTRGQGQHPGGRQPRPRQGALGGRGSTCCISSPKAPKRGKLSPQETPGRTEGGSGSERKAAGQWRAM